MAQTPLSPQKTLVVTHLKKQDTHSLHGQQYKFRTPSVTGP